VKKQYTRNQAEKTVKERDAWWTVIVIDPLVMRFLPFLANKTSLTPNQLTLLSFFFSVLAAAAFLNGSHWCLICGAFLGQIRFF
jgi:hypothetical protein